MKINFFRFTIHERHWPIKQSTNVVRFKDLKEDNFGEFVEDLDLTFSESKLVTEQVKLSKSKKRHELFAAPVTKFLISVSAYLVFLGVFVYSLIMAPMTDKIDWQTVYLILYVTSFAIQQIQVMLQIPGYMRHRFKHFIQMNAFNIFYVMAILRWV